MKTKLPTDHEPSVSPSAQTAAALKYIDSLKSELGANIKSLKRQGYISLVLSVTIGALIYFDIKNSLDKQLFMLDISDHPTQVLAYLIFRGSALGAIATTVLYLGARLTIASFDQEVRFVKRQLATLFLEFLYVRHETQLRGRVSVTELMAAFETWNKTVESAFSSVKVERETVSPSPPEGSHTKRSGTGEMSAKASIPANTTSE